MKTLAFASFVLALAACVGESKLTPEQISQCPQALVEQYDTSKIEPCSQGYREYVSSVNSMPDFCNELKSEYDKKVELVRACQDSASASQANVAATYRNTRVVLYTALQNNSTVQLDPNWFGVHLWGRLQNGDWRSESIVVDANDAAQIVFLSGTVDAKLFVEYAF